MPIRTPCRDNRVWTSDASSVATMPSPASSFFGAWCEARVRYLWNLVTSSGLFTGQTLYYFDTTSGNNSNDGFDGIVKASSTSFSWTESTKTLTKTGAFASYTWQPGDRIYIVSGTGATAGYYTVASKTSNNAIVLTTSLSSGAVDLGAVITVSSGPKQTVAAATTLLAGNNVRILFKRGIRKTGLTTGLTIAGTNCSIGTYGTGRRAQLSTADTAQVCGGSWTTTGFSSQTGVTYTNATKTVTKTNAFTNYVWKQGDTLVITAGTGVTPGTYVIASRVDASNLILATAAGGVAPTDVAFNSSLIVPGYVTRAAATKVSGVREQGNTNRFYTQVSSVAECQTIKGSFWHDTGNNRLYVNHYFSIDLTNSSDPAILEFFPETSSDGVFITNGTGSTHIEGLEIVGFGALSDTTKNAKYGIHSQLSGSDICFVQDCGVFFNNNHNIGQEQGIATGGILACVGCEAGWVTNADTPYVCYAGNGGQELYLVDCEAVAGDMLRISSGVPVGTAWGCSQVGMWLTHTDGSGSHYSAFAVNLRGKVRGGPQQCAGLGASSNVPLFTTDPTACRSFDIDAYYQTQHPGLKDNQFRPSNAFAEGKVPYQVGGGNYVDGFSHMSLNCTLETTPQWLGASVDITACMDKFAGLWVNGTILADCSFIEPNDRTRLLSIGLVESGTDLTASFYNCHVHIFGLNTVEAGLVSRSASNITTGNSQNPLKFEWKDSIVTVEAGANSYFGAGNNHDASGVLLSPSRCVNTVSSNPYNTDTSRGDSAVTGTVTRVGAWRPGQKPKIGEIDAVQNAFISSSSFVGYDKNWTPRRSTVTAMGPVEAA
jgi:hypothetical protein